jgi:hypothetical protein
MRRQLVMLLTGGQAHMTFDDAVADFPGWAMNQKAANVAYTPWHILEHLRITQRDMLEYITNPAGYVELHWPVDYWPAQDAETDKAGFRRTLDQFRDDLRALQQVAEDPSTDLYAVLEGTPGHTAYRGISIIGNHNSYHVGEFAALRQVMGSWGPGHS